MKRKLWSGKGGWYLCCLTAVLILTACGCGGSTINPAVSMEQMASEPSNDQVLAPGDTVDVKFLYNPELDQRDVRVRPDGKMALPIIGDVAAQGKELNVLQDELNNAYASQLRKPAVTLIARTLRNSKVYVGGEVNKPGDIDIPGRLTALEAVGQAGGFKTDTAEPANVVIIRTRYGKQYGTSLNLKKALTGAEIQPFYLRPGDIVWVPQTRIAEINQWVDQHINRIIPRIPVSMSAVP